MNLIPDGLISRFSQFKKYEEANNFNYGKFWNEDEKKNEVIDKGDRG